MRGSKGSVLVTGGRGFIGAQVADALSKREYTVGILDLPVAGREVASRRSRYATHLCDVRDLKAVAKVVRGYDNIIHHAALTDPANSMADPATTYSVNVTGTLNLLRAAVDADAHKFIFASSAAVYGETGSAPAAEEAAGNPVSVYGTSKLAAEGLCASFSKASGIRTVSLRYFNVYGPGWKPDRYSGVVRSFVSRIRAGERPVIFGDGMQTRDFVSVEDAIRANLLALEKDVPSGLAINIGTGRATSLITLARIVAKALGRPKVKPLFAEAREGDIRNSCADIRRARLLLGYSPKVPIEEALKELAAWLLNTVARESSSPQATRESEASITPVRRRAIRASGNPALRGRKR